MDIIHKHEWEYIKQQPSFWNSYDKPIPVKDRDLAVLMVENVVILPKFFIDNNFTELLNHQVGADIINRRVKEEYQGDALTKMTTTIEPRKEQIAIFDTIKDRVKNNKPVNGLVIAQPGFGKKQPYSEPILTPSGWTTMGKLKVGSKVIGKNGKLINVTHIHEHGTSDVYKITFQDGTYANCGIDHLWTVYNILKHPDRKYETKTLEDIIKDYQISDNQIIQKRYRYSVDLVEPVVYDKQEIDLHPYALGLLLGDDSFRNGEITYSNKSTIDILKHYILKFDSTATFSKSLKYEDGIIFNIKSKKTKDYIKQLGLFVNKFIPCNYLLASPLERRSLVQGLLDTNSHKNIKSLDLTEYYTPSPKLREDFIKICRSLGIYVASAKDPTYIIKGKTVQDNYRVLISFSKHRKTIINIEKLDTPENSRCITVDAKDHLYITRDFTVTHNSIVAIKTVELLQVKSLIIVPNDILEEQFVDSIVEFTNLTKDDIGVIQGSDIDILQKKGVYQKDIVVAKIQSLYSQLKNININTLYELYSCFGLVIYDEAHVGNASDGYSKTGVMFKTNNVLSMTATPYRTGINDFIFRNNTGGILYHSDHQNLIPQINLHNGIIEFTPKEQSRLQYAKTDYINFMATYNMILETKDVYFEWIANWVVYRESQGYKTAVLFATNKMVKKLGDVLKRKGLDVGILTGQTGKKIELPKKYLTKEQVELFYENYFKTFPKRKKCPTLKPFKDDDTKFSLTKPMLKDLDKMGTLSGKLKINMTIPNNMSDREIMKAKDTIISNFKLLSAGFDKSELSCIFFGSLIVGKVPVIQSLGRICRTHPDKINDVQAHFMFTQLFMTYFPDMLHILVNNIKLQYPSKFTYEGFDFDKKNK